MITKNIFKNLGPGLLYAAAAIGVSHLVQSTRAGASFGFELLWAVILANLLKYPFFKFGPLYTLHANESLLEGYKKISPWAIYVFFIITLGTIFTVQAAITIVTAGLANQLFQLEISSVLMSFILLVICSLILILGNYKILDKLIKVIIIVLTITTFIAVITAYLHPVASTGSRPSFDFNDSGHIFFLIALIGWMPGPLDIPIWQSLWTMEKRKSSDDKSIHTAMIDFNIGYIGTAILAMGFLTLGSLIMYPTGNEFSGKANEFSGQLISLYTHAIGGWAFPIIVICAFSTMFSTCLTCLDAFPRILREGFRVLKPIAPHKLKKIYILFLVLVVIGTQLILSCYLTNMKELVDFATTMSFLVAPIFAYLNYKVMFLSHIPKEHRPQGAIKYLAWCGFVFLLGFGLYYLKIKFL